MQTALIIFNQVLIMFLLMAVGYLCTKTNLISETGGKELSSLLITVISPVIIINSYLRPFDKELLIKFGWATLLSIGIHILSIVVSTIVFRDDHQRTFPPLRMCSVFSNSGFMAIPLITAVFGMEGVFIGSAYITVMNAFSWTYGVYLMTGDKKMISLKKAIVNPATIGVLIGLVIFCFNIALPDTVVKTIGYLSNLNTPLAMVVMGTFVARADLPHALKNAATYKVAALRLMVIPALVIGIFCLIPLDSTILMTILLSSSCPSAIAGMMFAAKFGGDFKTSSALIAITTLLSVITMPIIVSISTALWG